VSFFIGCEGVVIVEQFDTMLLYPMFMNCYYHLHPSIEFDNDFVDQRVDDDNNLDIFQMNQRILSQQKNLLRENC
jgi:hypothetical protein